MNVARTAELDGDLYVHVSDFIEHLKICSESVVAFCGDSAPTGAKIVSETLDQTIDTLKSLT
jgi:hypothetical protein